MDIAFPRLLCSFQVLSSPCYFTSVRRTAAQVQLKYAFSCSATPSSVLLVLWVHSDSFSVAESLGQCMIYLQRKVPLFSPSKSSSNPCFKLCLWSQIYQIWSLFTKFSQSRFMLLSFVFLEDLQGEMWFWNVRTAHGETWTAEKTEHTSVNFYVPVLPTWLSRNSKLRPPQGLVTACYEEKDSMNHNMGEHKNSKKKTIYQEFSEPSSTKIYHCWIQWGQTCTLTSGLTICQKRVLVSHAILHLYMK